MELNKPFYVDDLPVQLDDSLLLTRLSYRRTKTDLEPPMIDEIKSICALALELSRPRAAYAFVTISEGAGNTLLIDNLVIDSAFVKDKMHGSVSTVIMAMTLGSNIDNKISDLFNKSEYTKAVVLDAAASCVADKTMKLFKSHINTLLYEESMELGKLRISPGQLDIPHYSRKPFMISSALKNSGVEIKESLMLLPQKSVISLSGVFNRSEN